MVSEVKVGAVFLKKASADDALDMLAGWPENAYAKMEKTLYELARNVIEGHPFKSDVSIGERVNRM